MYTSVLHEWTHEDICMKTEVIDSETNSETNGYIVDGGMRAVQIQMGRLSFYEFLKLKDPAFYTKGKPHLEELANLLQTFWEGNLEAPSGKKARVFIMNLPPRTGKSYTLVNFCSWVIGKTMYDKLCGLKEVPVRHSSPEKVITVSYNADVASKFSQFARDNLTTKPAYQGDIPFNELFDGVELTHGDSSKQEWTVNGEFFTYMGGGPKSGLTGKGCTLGIIDDPIKNAEEAMSQRVLDEWWSFYTGTFASRFEKGAKLIVNHTRWREEDLAGRLIKLEGDDAYVYSKKMVENEVVQNFDVLDDLGNVIRTESRIVDGDLLCEEICDWDEFFRLQKTICADAGSVVFRANYFQEPLDATGKMYGTFETYSWLPKEYGKRHCYVDTADKGKDSLCAIAYEDHGDKLYVIDVLHTKESMEYTEPELADLLSFNEVLHCVVEANNGGRGFMRNVEKLLINEYESDYVTMSPFTQTRNKESRILAGSNWCSKHVVFPRGWETRWPSFHRELTKHVKDGDNIHDDAADAITGLYDNHGIAKDTSYLPRQR